MIRPKPPKKAPFVQKIRNRATRSLSIGEREEIATIAKTKPNIDLEINFDYTRPTSAPNRCRVGSGKRWARRSPIPTWKGFDRVVAGYTDAVGGESYNQDLSERRAGTLIKRYLVDKYGIAGSDLVTVGYGKTKLKDPSQPMAEANRRVQVVNMQNKETASK